MFVEYEKCFYDGHELTSLFSVSNVVRPWPSLSVEAQDNPAGGSFVLGVRRPAKTVTMTLHAFGTSAQRRDAARQLSAWLAVDGARELSFSDDSGLCYMALPDGDADVELLCMGEAVEYTFLVPSPYMLGETKTAAVPSGGTATAVVSGTASALPTIEATAAVRDGSTGLWGVRVNDGDYVRVPIGTASAAAVEIDCADRTARANGTVVLPTLDSDWLELKPGSNTVENDHGTGACTLSYRERWLI